MKKYVIVILMCVIGAGTASGQTFSEWFRQKKTQKRYLLEQIAALKAYREVIQKGYGVARDGLSTVRKITDGEFALHDLFFTSLRKVSPWVKKYGRIADIIALQTATVRSASDQLGELRRSGRFSRSEMAYLQLVYGRLLADCTDVLEQVLETVSDGWFELGDDDRLSRIDELYGRARDQWTFGRQFGQEAWLLDMLRLREMNGINQMGRIYGPIIE